MNNYGVQHLLHYLNDFLTDGPPESPICKNKPNSMLQLCNQIQAPVKSSKNEGPSASITFFGIQLDAIAVEASITQERRDALLSELNQLYWRPIPRD